MGFPREVREEALVMAARRCCVCRQYKGVGVEVHHIVPEVDGGEDSLDNAIVLCFDCHCAAGHYNPKHPKGTRFSPSELRKHRNNWIQQVRESGEQPIKGERFSRYYSRHLICLDTGAAKNLLDLNREQIPFRYDFVLSTSVLDFMREVLEDNLPYTWESSMDSSGHYWGEGQYQSLQHFHEMHPEFGGKPSRPLVATDFRDNGLVPSRIIRRAVEAGLLPSEIGDVCVEEFGCGEGPDYYVSMRRPLFVFAELKNTSTIPIVLSGLRVRSEAKHAFVRKLLVEEPGEIINVGFRNLVLQPGEVLLVPECVVLSGRSFDPMHTVFEDTFEMSVEQIQSVGLSETGVGNDFFVIGPTSRVEGYELSVDDELVVASIHPFDPDKCYLYYRAWMVGSCPHLYVYDKGHGWRYLHEILSTSSVHSSATELVEFPEAVQRFRIVETDYEYTIIETLEFNGEVLIDQPLTLRRGDEVEFKTEASGTLVISGRYVANIAVPNNYLQIRQKRSLRAAYEISRGM